MYFAGYGYIPILLYPLSPLPSKHKDIKMYVFLVDAKIFQSKIRSIKPAGKDGICHYTSCHHHASHLLVVTSTGIAGDLLAVCRGYGCNVKKI
jgi:hypothetical protein